MKRSCIFKMSLMLLLLAQGFFLQPAESRGQPQRDLEQARQQFKTFYENSLREHGIVGSSFMLIHDHQVIDKEFYGQAHIEQHRQVDEETIYHWASITKTFTSIAIMQLKDRGKLRLDDPIVKHIPELREVHNPYGDMGEITIRHLMTHSAGFRMATWPWGGDQDWHPHEPQHWAQLVAMFPYTEILFKPGSKYSYSNPGIIFLGRVIELLTTDDYEVYIDKNILKPLEMYRSYFDHAPYHLLKHLSQSYFLKDGKLTPARWDLNTGITVSNGGLNAPLTDMVKYLNFLMGDPQKQAVYEQVLKRSSLEEMFQPQLEIQSISPETGAERYRAAIGLSFFLAERPGMRLIHHSGGQNAFITHFYLNPDSRTAYLVAFNTQASDGKKNTRVLDQEILEYVSKNIFPLFRKM